MAKKCTCPTECDCEDYANGLVSNYCPVHNEPWPEPWPECSVHGDYVVDCFACGKPFVSENPHEVDTRDDQKVYVGPDCYRRVMKCGEDGYQPPRGGPRLYPMPGTDKAPQYGELRVEIERLRAELATEKQARLHLLAELDQARRVIRAIGGALEP